MSGMERIVIVGSGIIGLAHAITAAERGHRVRLLERSARPLGASVRNFGTLWPIGLPFGEERDQALAGVRKWKELSAVAGFKADPCGSLSLSYREESLCVLDEFARSPEAVSEGFELLDASAVLRRHPMANPDGLLGALYSPHETCVYSRDAIDALVRHAVRIGVDVQFGRQVIAVHESAVETADGAHYTFDRLVIAAGEDMRTLFPRELARAGLVRCQLQMMRSEPVAARVGAICVSDLTLCHYPAFNGCPSLPALQDRMMEEMGEYIEKGIHVIAAQHGDGSFTIGDTHEYGEDFAPDYHSRHEHLILDYLATFLRIPDLRVASRWLGVYLKSPKGARQVVLQPRPNVTMVTAMGGLGMTLSWGLADRVVGSWAAASSSIASGLPE